MENQEYKILIVDDTPKNLQVLGNTLKQNNYKVEFAINGKSALDWVKKQKFDLILLDVMMPEMDGYEACEAIRKTKANNNIPIIFLTAKSESESIVKGFELGAQDYVTKPFNTSELLARVKTQLELKTSREKLESVNQWLEDEVKKRTLELEKANKELSVLDKSKTEFLNIISSEMRTPMNGIMGTLHLLKDQADSKEMVKLIGVLDESVARIEKFSSSALLISSLRTKKHKLKQTDIKFKELLEYSLIELTQKMKEKKVKIDFSDAQANPEFTGDYDLLIVCFSRIFENAINNSPENCTINVRVKESQSVINCEISDQGPGFSNDILEKKFETFSENNKQSNNNLSLDLSLIKLIVDAHNGKIDIYNAVDIGAVFQVVLNK